MTQTFARDRLELALARIDDPAGEGVRACLTVYRDAARMAAEASDTRRRTNALLGPLDGAIFTIKDLFDVAGEITRAGSKAIAADARPARQDAPVVARLRAAGAVIVAKTNMVEFAFSGVGLNPHFGTPGNPADRSRVPGGSTSGGAVAVGEGMCEIALGSDTGGSTRIPAALCGLVGWKPSKRRISTEGAVPISRTLDSIGPIARTVEDCANTDAVIAGERPAPIVPDKVKGLRLGIAEGLPLRNLDATVDACWTEALDRLAKSGAALSQKSLPLLDDMARVNAKGGIVPAEGIAVHGELIARRGSEIDPQILMRFERARKISSDDYAWMMQERRALVRAMDNRLGDLDALIMPTTPIVAPTIADMQVPDIFSRNNALLLSNTSIANFFDLCSISLPLPRHRTGPGGLPVGLMLMARNGSDRRLFGVSAALEQLFAA
jgi:aspartyl-tRNA(Asn)/glutamyl-tRNA(Gln) amidotransferase subunit A